MPDRDAPRTGLLAPPWRLLMQIGGDNQTTVGMEVSDTIVLGRTDPLTDFHPELDLTPYGGQENGVSRRHVTITQGGKALYVKDLGSTNGTRINGFQLEANQLYRLRDGDELELGRVRITVRFVRSPY
jgi:pSer/pThr/pTyr-binding forkhead associated (FHA) protein